MLKKIESIRKKPKEVRQRYAFWSALCFTLILIIFWGASLPPRFAKLMGKTPVVVEVDGGISRSFSDMKASVSESITALQDSLQKDSKLEVPEDASVEDSNVLDISALLQSTTSLQQDDQTIQEKNQKQVLIGTTSAKKIDSQED